MFSRVVLRPQLKDLAEDDDKDDCDDEEEEEQDDGGSPFVLPIKRLSGQKFFSGGKSRSNESWEKATNNCSLSPTNTAELKHCALRKYSKTDFSHTLCNLPLHN